MNQKDGFTLSIRYIILLLLALSNLWILYLIFEPLTVYPISWILGSFYGAQLNGNTIYFGELQIEIIPACIAASAYYLLLILNFTTPMKKTVRIKSIIISLGAFLAVNIFRIIVFALLFYYGFAYFDILHKITWYLISTIMVIGIWFGTVKLFNIREIPVYSDVRKILKDVKKNKEN